MVFYGIWHNNPSTTAETLLGTIPEKYAPNANYGFVSFSGNNHNLYITVVISNNGKIILENNGLTDTSINGFVVYKIQD